MFILAIKFKKALTISIYLISKLNKAIRAIIGFYITFLYTFINI